MNMFFFIIFKIEFLCQNKIKIDQGELKSKPNVHV